MKQTFRRAAMRLAAACLLTAVLAVLAVLMPVAATAQETQRIAAVVNEDAVSLFDVFERVKLVVFTSGLENSPETMQRITPQVLKALIDEHLRLQEGKRQNVEISDYDIDQAIAAIEASNQMPVGSFLKFLEERRIDVETLRSRLRAELTWSKLVNRRLLRSVNISDDDIDGELQRITENQGKPQYLISEIFLSVDKPSEDRNVRDNAQELATQLRNGADFKAMAVQFSEGVTAKKGGNVGWVTDDQLAPIVETTIKAMEPGSISDPIATGGGYLIVQLRNRGMVEGPNPGETKIDLRQILLALPPNPTPSDVEANMNLAEIIRETVTGCDDMVRIATETDPTMPSDLGVIQIKDTPPGIRTALSSLPVDTVSAPLRTEGGIHLFMVCDRIVAKTDLPDRDQIRNSLLLKRLDQVSRQYLRDLRRNAFVDIRI